MIGPKGRGTNMAAIIEACECGYVPGKVGVVIAPTSDAPAIDVAKKAGARVEIVEPGDDYGPRLLKALQGCNWLCLAGFLRLLPSEVLKAFPRHVLNIHPALLPRFGGKGMYGRHVHEAVVAAGVPESGCTVHLVTEVYDEGEIVWQERVPVYPSDTPQEVAARVLEKEKVAYPAALRKVIHANRA